LSIAEGWQAINPTVAERAARTAIDRLLAACITAF
jgi:hypothetical protein